MIDALLLECCLLIAPRLDASMYDGKTPLEVMKLALASCDPNLRVDSKDEVYINARFQGEVAGARRGVALGLRPAPPGFRSDSSDVTLRHDYGGSLSFVPDLHVDEDDEDFRVESDIRAAPHRGVSPLGAARARAAPVVNAGAHLDGLDDDDPFDISAKHLMPFTEERDDEDGFDLNAALDGASRRPIED